MSATPDEKDIAKARELYDGDVVVHRDPVMDIAQALADARAEEREACAKIVSDVEFLVPNGPETSYASQSREDMRLRILGRIRARSKP